MSYQLVFLVDIDSSSRPRTAIVGRRVLVQGICVWCESVGASQLRVEIDDGTSVALLQVRGEAASAELQDVQPGKMVRAMGQVHDAPLFASGRSWSRWIDATSVGIIDDPNAESLHVLETLVLYQKSSPPSTSTTPFASLSLLPIPTDTSSTINSPTVGTKRKLVIDKSARAAPSPGSRPSQPSLLEVDATKRSFANASIPPAEYQFHVSGTDLKHIGNGVKTLEMRLNNPPYSIIRANDRIKFNGKLVTTVKAVRKYAQLSTALEMETLSSLLPPVRGSVGVSLNGAVRLLRQFISETEEARHGVAVFELDVPLGASTAPRTPEEWSKLIYEFVGTKASAGCTLRDLQFAFPTLSVDKIEAMLTDLQMDAVVYFAKGVYRLV